MADNFNGSSWEREMDRWKVVKARTGRLELDQSEIVEEKRGRLEDFLA